MYSDLYAQFYQGVIAYFDDYMAIKEKPLGNKADIRKGTDAAKALYHFGEFYARHFKRKFKDRKNKPDIRDFLIGKCSDYLTLEAISNVSKHAELDMGSPQVLSSEDIYEVLVTTFFEDEHGRYYHHGKTVQIKLVDGSIRDLDDILVNVLNMWYEILYNDNILETQVYHSLNKDRKVPRNEVSSGEVMITVLGTYSFGFEEREYDEETGKVVKYVGNKLVKFEVTQKETGEKLNAEINFNNYEHFHIRQLKSREEKEVYFNEVVRKKGFIATGNDGTRYKFSSS